MPSLSRVVRPAAKASAVNGSGASAVSRSESHNESNRSDSSPSTSDPNDPASLAVVWVPSPNPMRTFIPTSLTRACPSPPGVVTWTALHRSRDEGSRSNSGTVPQPWAHRPPGRPCASRIARHRTQLRTCPSRKRTSEPGRSPRGRPPGRSTPGGPPTRWRPAPQRRRSVRRPARGDCRACCIRAPGGSGRSAWPPQRAAPPTRCCCAWSSRWSRSSCPPAAPTRRGHAGSATTCSWRRSWCWCGCCSACSSTARPVPPSCSPCPRCPCPRPPRVSASAARCRPRGCSPRCTTVCAWPRCWCASARRTPWPTPSGCSPRCPAHCTSWV